MDQATIVTLADGGQEVGARHVWSVAQCMAYLREDVKLGGLSARVPGVGTIHAAPWRPTVNDHVIGYWHMDGARLISSDDLAFILADRVFGRIA